MGERSGGYVRGRGRGRGNQGKDKWRDPSLPPSSAHKKSAVERELYSEVIGTFRDHGLSP